MKGNFEFSFLKSFKVKHPIVKEAFAEFIGTFLVNVIQFIQLEVYLIAYKMHFFL